MKFYFAIISNRISSLRKDLLILFVVAFVTILFSELLFYKYPAKTEILFRMGQMTIKLSYSFVSAFIFYFLVVHLPKEKKKVNTYRIISRKIGDINQFLSTMFFHMEQVTGDKLEGIDFDKKTISNILGKIPAHSPVKVMTTPMNKTFNDWYDYVQYNGEEMRKILVELYLLNETLDNELLELFGQMEQFISWDLTTNQGKPGNNELTLYAEVLTKLSKLSRAANSKFNEKYGKYNIEVTTAMEKRGEYKPL